MEWVSNIHATENNLLTCMMQYTLNDSCLPVLSPAQRCANSLGKPLQQIWINTQEIARQLPSLLKEINIDFGTSDKIFSSQWLSETEILIGSKCNKVSYHNSGCLVIYLHSPSNGINIFLALS